ncbi:hypothetical protein ACWC9T_32765, partial [Kitasatospora sp. NPDC001159]
LGDVKERIVEYLVGPALADGQPPSIEGGRGRRRFRGRAPMRLDSCNCSARDAVCLLDGHRHRDRRAAGSGFRPPAEAVAAE